ncbi:hypothetical protein C0J52_00127 [Blattella germanica]|nr:hypothetical protein C0J52_00127 [Blattella germanica]
MSPTRSDAKTQNHTMKKEKRQETIQKYFKSPDKHTSTNTTQNKKVQDKKGTNKKDASPKKRLSAAGKQDTLDKKLTTRKKMTTGNSTKQLTLKKSPKKYNSEPLKSPQKQQIAKKLKDKYKDVNKKKDTTKNLLEKHKMKGLTVEERKQKQKEEKKEKALEEKRKKVEERLKRKQEKMRLAEFMKQWNRQREDLECPLCDVIQIFLKALFDMQAEEDDEILETDNQTAVGVIDETGDITTKEAIKLATSAAGWSQMYQGTPLNKLIMDPATITEILRLHLLSSGGRSGEMSSKWRYQQRGGYTSLDDPGLFLRMEHPEILRALSVMSVCDLSLDYKLQILTCLMNQILTYATVRDVIDERGEKVKQLRSEIRANQIAELKKEREAAAIRMKEKKEAKLKLKEASGAPTPPLSNSEKQVETDEKDARRQKLDRESSRRKQELQKKFRDLHHAVFGHQLVPIGCDRAHRRFWLFSSLPGLFVEHDEHWPGLCLSEPTPYNASLTKSDDAVSYIQKLFVEEGNGGGGSDKENDVGEETRPLATSSGNKKLLVEKNTGVNAVVMRVNSRDSASEKSAARNNVDRVEDSEKLTDKQQHLICTADIDTCPVHGKSVNRTKWSFFNKEEDIDNLIASLNRRGIRESDLRRMLIQEKPQIIQNLVNCPAHKLDTAHVYDIAIPEPRKSARSQKQEDANWSFPPGTPIDIILEQSLREYILDMEEKMQLGGLGSLKGYDKQCDKLVWGIEKIVNKEVNEEENSDDIPMEIDEIKERSTSPNSNDVENVYRDPGRLLEDGEQGKQDPIVNSLASAILQLGQCVEKKYLQKPLVGEDGSGDSDYSLIKRWETSLMASTSFSQLTLHLSSLDNSIQWSRSALNAHCRLCRRRGDGENMLLCDGCNKGHHLYCLKPKLAKVPQGDWFCFKCRPPEKKSRASNKNRRLFSADSDDEDVKEKEREKEKEKDKAQSPHKTTEGNETCSICGKTGKVICCSKCNLVYHMECLDPPMRKPPRSRWTCSNCKVVKDAECDSSKLSVKLRRCSANAAVAKISVFTKRLRSNSWDDTSSAQSDPDLQPTRRSGRRSLEVDLDLPLNNAVLQDLLTDVMHHKDAWPFLRPVPRAQVPDYHLIIKRPMDFGKMKYKLNMLEYRNNSEFIADALLIFENCQMYNQVDAQEYKISNNVMMDAHNIELFVAIFGVSIFICAVYNYSEEGNYPINNHNFINCVFESNDIWETLLKYVTFFSKLEIIVYEKSSAKKKIIQ